jgi:hypothetical protein
LPSSSTVAGVPASRRDHLPIRRVQRRGVLDEHWGRVVRQAERVHARLARGFPRGAGQQMCAGVAPLR